MKTTSGGARTCTYGRDAARLSPSPDSALRDYPPLGLLRSPLRKHLHTSISCATLPTMSDTTTNLPATLPELSPEAAEAFNNLKPWQQRFVIECQRNGGNSSEALRNSRDCSLWSEHAINVEASRFRNSPEIRLILGSALDSARAMLADASLRAVMTLDKIRARGDDPSATVSQQAVSERAAGRILDGNGITGRGATVQVNIDNRRIDDVALRLWQERNASAES